MDAILAVEMNQITKRFPGVIANDQVDFSACFGELHALIGENGAGKTTLMNVLYGMHRPDSGEIRVSGQPVEIENPNDAVALGIGMVHQHFMLVQAFTALENIILGSEPVKLGRTDYRTAENKIKALCERFQLNVELNTKVSELSVSAQQKVEILKALYRDARILILDEPTSVLAPQETESLFVMLRRMTSEGMCIILISHKLSDVMAYSDRVTVLRQGKTIACTNTASTSADELARLMVGSNTETEPTDRQTVQSEQPILIVNNLSVLRGSVSFDLFPGEILGVAGVDGNGQRELAEALIGLQKATGSASLDGQEILNMPVRRRLEVGVKYVPEDRRFAVVPEYSIQDNAILGLHSESQFARHGILNTSEVRSHASALIEKFDVRASGLDMPVGFLSGGNQQKLVLGRALSQKPKLLIACQPTQGLDVNATSEIHRHLLAERARGAGVLLISYDLDEILSLSDRVLVMYQGRIAGIFTREEANRENVGASMVRAC